MKYAKFIAALIGAGITAAAQNGIVLPPVVAQIAPLLTAFLVYFVPNKQS